MKSLLSRTKKHYLGILNKSRCRQLPFHNKDHTPEVFKNVKTILTYEKPDIEQRELLLIAALFHDTGNALCFTGHESISATLAILYLEKKGYPEDGIEIITDCIKATKIPQQPRTLSEEILCDADLFHLGTNNFESRNGLLRKEWAVFLNRTYSDSEWLKTNLEFLKSHRYHTEYGTLILEPKRHRNIQMLERRLI